MKSFLLIAVLALASCANRNYAIHDRKMTVTDMVNHIQCEVYHAWLPYADQTKGEEWIAAVTLTLQETLVNEVTPTFAAGEVVKEVTPIRTVTGGLGFSQTNTETRRYDFTINIKKIDPSVCNLASSRINGNLGIASVVAESLDALKLQDYSQSLNFTETKTFGKSVQFTVRTSVSAVGVTWLLKRFEGPGGFLGISRSQANTVDINFGKKAAKEDIKAAAKRTQDQNVKNQLQRLVNP